MGVFSGFLAFLSATPAQVGLALAALIAFLSSDWRVSLAVLMAEYLCIGLLLSRSALRPEVVLIKVLVGVLVVTILALSARYTRTAKGEAGPEPLGPHFLGLQLGWLEGPLGFPLRLLAVFLVVLALVRLFGNYHLTLVPLDVALLASWLGAMGFLGLVLSGDPVRVAVSVLTTLAGFDLVYSRVETSLAAIGFLSAFYLGAALAFGYLTIVHGLAADRREETEP